ncbi:MAG: hypothetical protein KC421_05055 [Anaerolineales bacterium]|nr:hypothetical protein [Anaerolineales bacterium]
MNENDKRETTISQAESIEEIGAFWDTHSVSDYWDKTREVEFDVRAQRRHRVTLAPEVYESLEIQARTRGIQLETLINLWLSEKLQAAQ